MIAVPLFLQMTLGYDAMKAGLSMAPLSLTMFGVALLAGKRAGRRRPAMIIRAGFVLAALGVAVIVVLVPRIDRGLALALPLVVVGAGFGMLVSQMNNYTLAPIAEERVSEAAGVNSASGNFGLSFGLAMAGGIMLATLSFSFTNLTERSDVIPPAEQARIATALEDDAEVMSDAQLDALITDQPPEVEAAILDVNAEARDRSLQVALLVPLLAALVGIANSFRMVRLPDIEPSGSLEGLDFG